MADPTSQSVAPSSDPQPGSVESNPAPKQPQRWLGRYAVFDEIAAGGMATVFIGRLVGPSGFTKTVAIKRLHTQLADDERFSKTIVDEARVLARIGHPNVVNVLDVVSVDGELWMVMDYIAAAPLSQLLREARLQAKPCTPAIAVAITAAVLRGLHAAHQALSEQGEPIGLVHCDVSPQNILVGSDGMVHVLDFGIARAADQRHDGLRGKPAYMAPEQLRGEPTTVATDIWAVSVVLWELLTGSRLFQGDQPASVARKVLQRPIDPPSLVNPSVDPCLDTIVAKGLDREPSDRFSSAAAMADDLERALGPASSTEVGRWVSDLSDTVMQERRRIVTEVEAASLQERHTRPSTAPTIRSSPSRSWMWALLIVGGVIIGGAFALRRPSTNPVPASTPNASAATPPSASQPATIQSTAASPSETPSSSTIPSASASAPVASASVPQHRYPVPPGAISPPPRPSTRTVNCEPPYVVDQEGFLKVRPECQ